MPEQSKKPWLQGREAIDYLSLRDRNALNRALGRPAAVPLYPEDALCRQVDPDIYFPENKQKSTPAKKVCSTCEVQAQCLDDPLDGMDHFGIRAGMRGLVRIKKKVK